VRRAGGRRTVPLLVDGADLIADSTDIVAWADARRPGTLIPAGAEGARALALEDDFDRQLGPAARRWAYFQLMPRRDLDPIIVRGVPRWQSRCFSLFRPFIVAMLRRGLNITAEGAARSSSKVDQTFDAVGELLRDGRAYLTGDRFTVADLTFASLASPVLLQPEHPFRLPAPELFGTDARHRIEAWRASPAGEFALHLYATERHAPPV